MILGRQFVIQLEGCAPAALADSRALAAALVVEAEAAGLTVVQTAARHFEPAGLTFVAVLSQSHLAVHTWPEHRSVVADLFICRADFDIEAFAARLRALTGASAVQVSMVFER